MSATVSLRDVIGEMDLVSDEITAFVNRRTGELYTARDEDLGAAEEEDDEVVDLAPPPAWERDLILKARQIVDSDDWAALPSKFDIHEWRIMRDFAETVEPEERRAELLRAVHGSGAFRYFKDCLHRHGIADDWYRFRTEAFKQNCHRVAGCARHGL